jgi:hypothetical protein
MIQFPKVLKMLCPTRLSSMAVLLKHVHRLPGIVRWIDGSTDNVFAARSAQGT